MISEGETVFPLSLMSLSTPVNISEATRSCIICEVEPRADALSDTHTELKLIVTLVLGSHTSPTTISLGSTTPGEIREMDWTQRRGKDRHGQRFKSHGLRWRGGYVMVFSIRQIDAKTKYWFAWNLQILCSLTLNRSNSFNIYHRVIAEIEEWIGIRKLMIQRLRSQFLWLILQSF